MLAFKTKAIPSNGTNEVQTGTIGGTPTAGSFQLILSGLATAAITWSNNNTTLMANIQAQLDLTFGVSSIVAAVGTMTAGIGTFTLTFQGLKGKMAQPGVMTVTNSLTGTVPTLVVALTTRGVWATQRGAAPGDQLVYTGPGCINEVQTITIGGSGLGGTFTLTGANAVPNAASLTTAAITWSGTNGTLISNIQSALDTTFGSGNTLVSALVLASGIGTINVQFIGANSTAAMGLMVATSSLTGTLPTVAVTRATTGGVASTATVLPVTYVNNSSTQYAPNWQPMGSYVLASLGSPALGSTITVHAGVADNGSSQTISTGFTQPDVPRCLVFTPSGTTANVTAVSIVATFLDPVGNTIVETLPAFTGGAATAVTSVNACKTLLSYVQPACGASVTITPTCSPKLGLGAVMTLASVRFGYLNGVLEATAPTGTAGGTTLSKNLVQLNSALNGTPVVVAYIPN